MSLFEFTKSLMDIPSVSGDEEAVGFYLRDYLQSLGWTVELQTVSGNQNNIIAYLNDTPRVWLSTHMDTVPPFIPPTEDMCGSKRVNKGVTPDLEDTPLLSRGLPHSEGKIYGRGACDAKGIIAAQIMAAEQLRKEGIEDIGLLYTVEEERSSTGAKAANKHPLAAKCEYMINGEPTDNDLAIGSKGSLRLMLRTQGKAAHSAYPEEGDSAVSKLLDILVDIQNAQFPNDEFFGETTVNIGTINGGVALNVIPAKAEAGLLIRLTTPLEPVMEIVERAVADRGDIEILSYSLPVRMLQVEGFKQKVVRFTTDIPHLPNWGQPLLLGPGSILAAHTKDEFVLKQDLETSVELYTNLVKKLLNAEIAENAEA